MRRLRRAPIAAPMPVPVAVPMPVLVTMPAEMVLTEEDAAGAALIAVGDLAESAVVTTALITEERGESVAEEPDALRGLDLAASSALYSVESLQKAAVDILSAAKNQDTPADALDNAEWTVTDGEVRVQTDLSKTMLPMVINIEAEKLVKNALRDAGAGDFEAGAVAWHEECCRRHEETESGKERKRTGEGDGTSDCAARTNAVQCGDSECDRLRDNE